MAARDAAAGAVLQGVRGGPAGPGRFGQATGRLRHAHGGGTPACVVPHAGADALCAGRARYRRLDRVSVCGPPRRRSRARGAAGRQHSRRDAQARDRAGTRQLEELALPVQQRAGPARSLAGRARAHPGRMVLLTEDGQQARRVQPRGHRRIRARLPDAGRPARHAGLLPSGRAGRRTEPRLARHAFDRAGACAGR
ncbi:hypothetical protein D3C72_1406590 [compost metagenome]